MTLLSIVHDDMQYIKINIKNKEDNKKKKYKICLNKKNKCMTSKPIVNFIYY
jgi:hypothetical protein